MILCHWSPFLALVGGERRCLSPAQALPVPHPLVTHHQPLTKSGRVHKKPLHAAWCCPKSSCVHKTPMGAKQQCKRSDPAHRTGPSTIGFAPPVGPGPSTPLRSPWPCHHTARSVPTVAHACLLTAELFLQPCGVA